MGLTAKQQEYIDEILEMSLDSCRIYQYTVLSVEEKEIGKVVVKWNVCPMDTLFEENGKDYVMEEELDSNGKIVDQKRVYDFFPDWIKNKQEPENLVRPCTVTYREKLDSFEFHTILI